MTTPYDRLMKVLSGKKAEVDRLPVINPASTYNYDSMKAYDAYWPAAHKDPEKMAKLAAGLHRMTGLDNITVPFELTFEAEILGAPVNFFEDKIKWPSVKGFVAHEISDLKFPKDVATAGRVPVVTKAIKILKEEFAGKVPIIAYINCPFTSISSYLVEPVEFLKSLRKQPEKVREFYKASYPFYGEIANAFKEAGADVITYREEGVSLDNISIKDFDEYVKPYLAKLVGLTKGPKILHTCGLCVSGQKEIIGRMLEVGVDAISIEERTPMKATREFADKVKPGFPICGNIGPFSVIHNGPIERIKMAVKKVIEDGVDIVSPGCDFYLETPNEHVKAFVDAAIEFGTKKQ